MTEERQDAADARMDAQDRKADRRYQRSWWWYVLLVSYLVIGPGAAIGISALNQRQSERAWCEIITTLDDAYRVTPPTTPVGIQLAAAMHRLRSSYHC